MNERDDRDEERPLDPATERLRRKMVRLLAVSIGVMLAGVMAVLAAVVYKATERSDDTVLPLVAGATATIQLPAGTRVLDSDLDGSRILLRVAAGSGAERLIVADVTSGSILSEVTLQTQ
ncbi:hypothetical protein [Mangrovicella endophytica]|uniref:hypothetical protein n=1 Tax=Mangrovicella endophytica TaxID=2066697 RepID=UPI0018E42AA7|nr:hypothetical protein [Mangrovicella endophytica]